MQRAIWWGRLPRTGGAVPGWESWPSTPRRCPSAALRCCPPQSAPGSPRAGLWSREQTGRQRKTASGLGRALSGRGIIHHRLVGIAPLPSLQAQCKPWVADGAFYVDSRHTAQRSLSQRNSGHSLKPVVTLVKRQLFTWRKFSSTMLNIRINFFYVSNNLEKG